MIENESQQIRVIAVASGKGGVGKTNVSVNLAVAMSMMGHHVMLMDADLGLANVDVVLGLQPKANLSHVIDGTATLDGILLDGPRGIKIIPGASGISRMANLSDQEHAGLIRAFNDLKNPVEVLIIDTPAGITNDVLYFSRAANDVLVVVCDEPASMTDAYALIKLLYREQSIDRFHVLANRVANEQQGKSLFKKMAAVCGRFLSVTLDYAGSIPEDNFLRQAVQKQKAVVDAWPGSVSSKAFKALAYRVDSWPKDVSVPGHLAFFVERMIDLNVGSVAPWDE